MFEWLVLVVSIFLSAFFSSSESALLSISNARANTLSNKYIKKLKKEEEKAVISILLGNNLVNVLSSSLAAEISLKIFNTLGIAFSTFVMTFILLTFGEVIPKSIALYKKEKLLYSTAKYLYFWFYITSPISNFYLLFMEKIRRWFRVRKAKKITEEEIEEMLALGSKYGELSSYERDVAVNALDLNEITAKDIMTKAKNVFLFDANKTVKTLKKIIRDKNVNFSRIPVYVKNKNRVIGYVKVSDVLNVPDSKKLIDFLRSILVIDENKSLEVILSMMRRNGVPIVAVKRDGKLLGILTIQDIVDELLGEFNEEQIKSSKK